MQLFGKRVPAAASLLVWALAWEIVGQAGLTALFPRCRA